MPISVEMSRVDAHSDERPIHWPHWLTDWLSIYRADEHFTNVNAIHAGLMLSSELLRVAVALKTTSKPGA